MKLALKFIYGFFCVVLSINNSFALHAFVSDQLQNYLEQSNIYQQRTISTIYGDFDVTEPVLLELFDHPVLERIKHVRQYGACYYACQEGNDYTRYQHSVGVWALLRKYGAALDEQVAGLLHDVSHTVFSHVGDYLFKYSHEYAYQDDIYEWYLEQQGVHKVLEKYGFTLDQVNPKNEAFLMLAPEIPDLSADRIEYNLKAGLLTQMLTQQDVDAMLKDVTFVDGTWYFQDPVLAKKLCDVALYNTVYVWGGLHSFMVDTWTSQALQRSLDTNILTLDDIHYSADDVVWEKLKASSDSVISDCVKNILNDHTNKPYTIVPVAQGDMIISPKFRGLNPWIKTMDGLKRLTEIDKIYKKEFEETKDLVKSGWGVKFFST